MDENRDEEILLSLFRNTGVHSALKHDKIVESGNPDYVLVEKEAERVAKQASEALRKSRALCRTVSVGVPTWTGSHGSAGATTGTKRPRFGAKTISHDNTAVALSSDNKNGSFDGTDMLTTNNAEEGTSSASLLQKMRARSALAGKVTSTDIDTRHYSVHGPSTDGKEAELLKDIRDFVALRARNLGQATTQEILQEFQPRIANHKNAMFKEMLKQVCDFHKVNRAGVWHLKTGFE